LVMAKFAQREALQAYRSSLMVEAGKNKNRLISLCSGSGCGAYGTANVHRTLVEELIKHGLQEKVEVRLTGCHGFCEKGPIMVIHPEGIFYSQVKEDHVPEIVTKTLVAGELVDKLIFKNPVDKKKITKEEDIPFYKLQERVILGNNGMIDPTSIDHYLAVGGYAALEKALFEMKPKGILEEIKKSGLRGRGGGGFPTGIKWATCAKHHGDRFVICNADEGDPGAYMDRSLLEGNPHSVLEGMIIAARAIDSREGYVYVRHEYPLAVTNLTIALQSAREKGLLGKNILGSGLDFDIKISRGGGAFVCGESTALMASLEGKPGRPRAKYVHTVEKGFRNSPSNLNNVETYANVPVIIDKGADWYAGIGTQYSKGTKIFSLVGKVVNTGLVEVPMGTSLRKIIFDIGGGIPKKKKFKAVQTGGPSGGCIPERFLDLPVDFDELAKVGSIMGSGGMIVMDQDTCMVDLARYFVDFLKDESCGQCNPCREGLKQMLEILTRICNGQGVEGDVELLEELGSMIQKFSLCGLGTSAPNPVLTTILYFRDEYMAHIRDHKCPAGVCKPLFHYEIDTEACTGCQVCLRKCPQEAISGEKKKTHAIDQDNCIKCGICYDGCKFDAIKIR
jgi:NADH:ubiquinone oxidoreductase subunit F (NADH-binding)/(2Fe-2S) ferredoxin/Pyruvate/2-oxoacid:ferredoxin oxidoreductase delta subunit